MTAVDANAHGGCFEGRVLDSSCQSLCGCMADCGHLEPQGVLDQDTAWWMFGRFVFGTVGAEVRLPPYSVHFLRFARYAQCLLASGASRKARDAGDALGSKCWVWTACS